MFTGSHQYLLDYETKRQRHVVPMMFSIDALHRLYTTEFTPVVLARSLGVTILDALNPVKVRINYNAFFFNCTLVFNLKLVFSI